MSGKYTYKCYRQEWCIVLESINPNSGMSEDKEILESWPTREEAKARLEKHGVPHKHIDGVWLPFRPAHDYQRLSVVCCQTPVNVTEALNDQA